MLSILPPRYALKASFRITGALGAERSKAPQAPRYPLKASSEIPGAEGAERSKAPEATRYPLKASFKSFLFKLPFKASFQASLKAPFSIRGRCRYNHLSHNMTLLAKVTNN